MSKALGNVELRLISLLYAVVMAVVDFFWSITLQHIWNGPCAPAWVASLKYL